jgi:chitodextrinase
VATSPAPAPDTTPPSVPAGLGATAGDTQVALSWSASTDNVGVTGYRVYRNGTLVGSPTGTTYTDTGLTDGTTYTYTVAAIDAAGNLSAQSASVSATPMAAADTTPPTPPTTVTASAGNAQVALSWSGAKDNVGVDHYFIQRNGAWIYSTTGPVTSFTDTGYVNGSAGTALTNGTQYCYTVGAVDAAGNVSTSSSQACATPTGTTTSSDTTAPSVPTGLQAAPANAQVGLSWSASSDNVGVTGYRVYRNGTLVGSPSGTSYTDTGLTNGTSYSYTVAATDAAGNVSTQSSPVTATPTASTSGSTSCSLYASTSGSDSNSGTATAPFASPQTLLNALAPGQVGCVRGGTYHVSELRSTHSGSSGAPITLESYPGERATIITDTDIYVPDPIAYNSFVNLNLTNNLSSGSVAASMIQDFGENTVWQGDDISGNDHSTCMELGSVGYGTAHNTLVQQNKIHDCGSTADGNQDHGIYVAISSGATITGNVFWSAAAYAVQLYPNADGTSVTHNVFDGSGYGAVIFASDEYASGLTSDNNSVAYNVIADGTRYGLDYWWGPAGQGTGNSANSNCFYNNGISDLQGSMTGITVTNTVHGNPQFMNPGAHDYRLQSGSPCLSVVGYDAAAQLGF